MPPPGWADRWVDRTPRMLRTGYGFLPGLLRRRGTDVADVRLMGRMTTCITGPGAVQLFYDPTRLTRQGAGCGRLRRGRCTVHGEADAHDLGNEADVFGLDGEAHARRKAQFLALLSPESAGEITHATGDWWRRAAAGRWSGGRPVDVFDDAVLALCVSMCRWAGVPDRSVDRALARDLAAVVDGLPGPGPRHVEARMARRRVGGWARSLVDGVRAGRLPVREGAPLEVIARRWDEGGGRLGPAVAAAELVNLVGPAVAVAWPVVCATVSLRDHPDSAPSLRAGGEAHLAGFVDEVRRMYPLAPMLAARARRDFSWHGHRVPAGRLVLLDVHGTLRDPRLWPDPDRFLPDRFVGRAPDPYTLIPQGGGDPATGHRCPGEILTVEITKEWVRLLCGLEYEVARGATIRLSRVPARPSPPVLLRNVRLPSMA